MRLQFSLGTKMCNFDPKIWIFGPKSQFFVLESRFLSIEHITITPRATAYPFGPPRKNPSNGSFFWACLFVAVWPSSTQLGGTVQAIKKWPRMTTDLVPAGTTEKRPFSRSAEECFFGQKWVLTQKITQNFLRDWYLFGKRQLFSLNNFFRSWPEHG